MVSAFVSFSPTNKPSVCVPSRRSACPAHRPRVPTMQTPVPTTPTSTNLLTLYGAPVSNYTARCRYIIYRKNLLDTVSILPPSELGGLKSDAYKSLNPFGKMPLAVAHSPSRPDQPIFESDVICDYIADKFSNHSPSFIPDAPEARARSRNIVAVINTYIAQHHPFMYKNVPGDRVEGVSSMKLGFDAIENLLDDIGPFAAGETLSVADCCLLGNFPFYDFMLPTFFGWSPLDGRPKLAKWHTAILNESQAARDVYNEVFTALQAWWDNGRWEKLGVAALTPRPESSV